MTALNIRFDHGPHTSSADPAPSPRPAVTGGANQGEARSAPSIPAGWIRWPIAYTAACHRIGLTPRETLVVQILYDLPDDGREDVKFISAGTLALWMYGKATKSRIREAGRLLTSLQLKGFVTVAAEANQHRAARYDLTNLRRAIVGTTGASKYAFSTNEETTR